MSTSWNDAEEDALQGLPWLSQLLYLRGLRRFMDYRDGVVGVARGISYQSLRETLFVEPATGRQHAGMPTLKTVRVAIGQLIEARLVESIGTDKRLIFRLPKALSDDSARKKEGRPRADLGQTYQGTDFTGSNQQDTEKEGRPRAEYTPVYQGNPPVSGIRKDSVAIATGASASSSDPKTAIWDLGERYLGSRAIVGKLVKKHGEARVFHAIAQTATHNPADATAYIHGILKVNGHETHRRPDAPRTTAERGEAFGAECWDRIKRERSVAGVD